MVNKIYLRTDDFVKKQKEIDKSTDDKFQIRFRFSINDTTYYNLDSIIHIVSYRSYIKGISKVYIKNILNTGILNFINIILGRRDKLNFTLKEVKELEKGIWDYCN